MNKIQTLLLTLLTTVSVSAAVSGAAEAKPCFYNKLDSQALASKFNLSNGSLWNKIPPIKPEYGAMAGLALSGVGLLGLGTIYLKRRSAEVADNSVAILLEEPVYTEHPEAPGGELDVVASETQTPEAAEKEKVLI